MKTNMKTAAADTLPLNTIIDGDCIEVPRYRDNY